MESHHSSTYTPNSNDAVSATAAAMPSSSASTKAAAKRSHSGRKVRSSKKDTRSQYNLNHKGEVGTLERDMFNTKRRMKKAPSKEKEHKERDTLKQQTISLKRRDLLIEQQKCEQEYEGLVMHHESVDKALSILNAENERSHSTVIQSGTRLHTSVGKISDNLTACRQDRMKNDRNFRNRFSKSSRKKRKRTNQAQQQFFTSSVQVQRSPQVPETFHLDSSRSFSDNGEEEMEEESMNPWDIDSLQLSLSNPSSTGELNPRRLLNEFQNSTIGSSEMKKISCKKSPASSSQHDKEGEEDHASENADEETDLETKAHDSEYNQLHAWKTREASSHYTTVKETTHPTAHCTTVRETTHPTARPYRNVAITKPTVTITEPPLDLTDRSLDIGIDDDEDEDDDEFIII
mmetsp:Transcript_55302/g.61697  ORF Transcript_55302/g.61697 Transcript_55302/m.61697 type:complete len:404 (+) Transcript_55302:109-1320(+)